MDGHKTHRPGKWRRLVCGLGVLLLAAVLVAAIYSAWRFRWGEAVAYEDIQEHFKYGSTGGEVNLGFPYWLWQSMPLMCAQRLPRERLAADYLQRVKYRSKLSASERMALSREGYKSLGLIYETGPDGTEKDLPVGVSERRNLGLDRVFVNCAVCHSSTYRKAANDAPAIVLGMPANLFDLYDLQNFFFGCAKDQRFNKENLIPEVQDLGADLDFIDQRIVYPLAIWLLGDRVKLLENRLRYFYDQPDWGPGRVDTFSAAKAVFNWQWDQDPDHEAIGTADFPSIWLQEPRKRRSDGKQMELHWDGNNWSTEERNLNAAFGTGAQPPIIDYDQIGRIQDWLLTVEPPPFPFDIDKQLAAKGAGIYANYCTDCHGVNGRDFSGKHVGFVTPIDEIATDPHRLDNYTAELNVNLGALYAEASHRGEDKRFRNFHKTFGYSNPPLDGIWLRAPYLHNGSVPTLRDLLEPADKRPKQFYRGNDLYEPGRVGFVSTVASENGRGYFLFDTAIAGNSNQGHEGVAYGTELTPEQKDAVVEYMKTF